MVTNTTIDKVEGKIVEVTITASHTYPVQSYESIKGEVSMTMDLQDTESHDIDEQVNMLKDKVVSNVMDTVNSLVTKRLGK